VDERDAFHTRPDSLAQIMGLGEADPEMWKPEELGAILRHQLSAPVDFDLRYLGSEAVERFGAIGMPSDPPIESFHDLLHHPRPPVELLRLTKEFARACRSRPDSLLPDDVAAMLYVLSIVVALTKCGQRITGLDDQALRHSLDWTLEQSWVDEATRELLNEGFQSLSSAEPDPDA